MGDGRLDQRHQAQLAKVTAVPALGYKTVDLLVENGLISNPADIFFLQPEDLLGFEAIDSDLYYISRLPSDVQVGDVTLIATVAFIITVLFALLPAARAAKVQPAEALRYE